MQSYAGPLAVVVIKGTWCAVCAAQVSRLATYRDELIQLGAGIVVLSPDGAEANKAYGTRIRSPFPVLGDPDHSELAELGLWLPEPGYAMPSVLFVDRCGQLVATKRGRQPGVGDEHAIMGRLRQMAASPAQCRALDS